MILQPSLVHALQAQYQTHLLLAAKQLSAVFLMSLHRLNSVPMGQQNHWRVNAPPLVHLESLG